MAQYIAINNTTYADITAVNNSKEQRWILKTDFASRGKNPFTRLTGGYGPRLGGKAVIEVADTKKVKGDTINIQTLAPLAGPGVQGDNVRLGNEEKILNNSYQFTLGRMFKSMAWSSVAANQTVVGSNLDRQANQMLGEWLGWRKGTDIEMAMIAQQGARNQLFPNGKANREALRSNDYVNDGTITQANMRLSLLQGKPMKVGKAQGGWDIKKYVFMSNQFALYQWSQTATYKTLVSNAREKGESNELWAGGYPDIDGNALYRWNIEDHTGAGPIGAPCAPRATLGVALTADDTSQDITGGGNATNGAKTTPLYFEFFSNAQYMGFEGVKIAASTATTRYVAIQSVSGANQGKIFFASYTVNNGNKLTMANRLRASSSGISLTTLGNVTWDTAPWVAATYLTDSAPSGSIVYETNSYGVPFTKSYMLADEALMSGYGTVDGQTAFGLRQEEKQDYKRVYGVGIDSCWGVQCIPRVDGIFGGFILVESAFQPDGFPSV